MPNAHAHCEQESKRESLMSAACELFLNNDYNKVSTRQLATRAGTSLSMISYYFGSKQGLYNTMVRKQFKEISMALESAYSEESGLDFNILMHNNLKIHNQHPGFPAFIMKILIYKDGPGYMLFSEILDKKRDLIRRIFTVCQEKEQISKHIDIDAFHIVMMSLTISPLLIISGLAHSKKMTVTPALMETITCFSGEILTHFTQIDKNEFWKSIAR